MRIGIIGLGGVGGAFGGRLAARYGDASEHEVVFIARGEHLRAIRSQGLRLAKPDGELIARPSLATDDPATAGPLDLALFAVKSYGLEGAARSMAGNIHDHSVVIPLLNGVDSTERLQDILPRGVFLHGTVYISAYIEAPGVVRQVSPAGRLIFGPASGGVEDFRGIDRLFQDAGIVSELTSDPIAALWTKFIFICPAAAVTSLTRKSFGAVMDDPEAKGMLMGMIAEVERIARAKGVALPGDVAAATLAKVGQFPPETKTSLQLDFEKGRQTEIDTLAGFIVRSGRKLGIATPLHDRAYEILTKKA
ncbi:MAG: 2-dehydropantoate 2-reductase [Pseudomonadota bacterium]|nr:2-dehydropantoate 2-reductase [Pseudomonadota bacterium]